jgi:hypothetical protein
MPYIDTILNFNPGPNIIHLTVTYDVREKKAHFYENGKLIGTHNIAHVTFIKFNASSQINLGKSANNTYFIGHIRDFRIYTKNIDTDVAENICVQASDKSIPTTAWSHVTNSYKFSNNMLHTYINGVLTDKREYDVPQTIVTRNIEDIHIGNGFSGSIHGLVIAERNLTKPEIDYLVSNKSKNKVVFKYSFTDDGTLTTDSIGTGLMTSIITDPLIENGLSRGGVMISHATTKLIVDTSQFAGHLEPFMVQITFKPKTSITYDILRFDTESAQVTFVAGVSSNKITITNPSVDIISSDFTTLLIKFDVDELGVQATSVMNQTTHVTESSNLSYQTPIPRLIEIGIDHVYLSSVCMEIGSNILPAPKQFVIPNLEDTMVDFTSLSKYFEISNTDFTETDGVISTNVRTHTVSNQRFKLPLHVECELKCSQGDYVAIHMFNTDTVLESSVGIDGLRGICWGFSEYGTKLDFSGVQIYTEYTSTAFVRFSLFVDERVARMYYEDGTGLLIHEVLRSEDALFWNSLGETKDGTVGIYSRSGGGGFSNFKVTSYDSNIALETLIAPDLMTRGFEDVVVPILDYDFDGSSGTTVYNNVWLGSNGVLVGSPGPIRTSPSYFDNGRCMTFTDANNGYVAVPTEHLGNLVLCNFSVSMWIYPSTGTYVNPRNLLEIPVSSTGDVVIIGLSSLLPPSYNKMCYRSPVTGPYTTHDTQIPIPAGTWSHVVITFDKFSSSTQMFVKTTGSSRITDETTSLVNHISKGTGSNIKIGEGFRGSIDSFKMYKGILGSIEIDALSKIPEVFDNQVVISSNDRYTHVAAVYSEDKNMVTTYLNGEYNGCYENYLPDGATIISNSSDMLVGFQENDNGGDFYDGYIDDVRIYKIALNGRHVRSIYNSINETSKWVSEFVFEVIDSAPLAHTVTTLKVVQPLVYTRPNTGSTFSLLVNIYIFASTKYMFTSEEELKTFVTTNATDSDILVFTHTIYTPVTFDLLLGVDPKPLIEKVYLTDTSSRQPIVEYNVFNDVVIHCVTLAYDDQMSYISSTLPFLVAVNMTFIIDLFSGSNILSIEQNGQIAVANTQKIGIKYGSSLGFDLSNLSTNEIYEDTSKKSSFIMNPVGIINYTLQIPIIHTPDYYDTRLSLNTINLTDFIFFLESDSTTYRFQGGSMEEPKQICANIRLVCINEIFDISSNVPFYEYSADIYLSKGEFVDVTSFVIDITYNSNQYYSEYSFDSDYVTISNQLMQTVEEIDLWKVDLRYLTTYTTPNQTLVKALCTPDQLYHLGKLTLRMKDSVVGVTDQTNLDVKYDLRNNLRISGSGTYDIHSTMMDRGDVLIQWSDKVVLSLHISVSGSIVNLQVFIKTTPEVDTQTFKFTILSRFDHTYFSDQYISSLLVSYIDTTGSSPEYERNLSYSYGEGVDVNRHLVTYNITNDGASLSDTDFGLKLWKETSHSTYEEYSPVSYNFTFPIPDIGGDYSIAFKLGPGFDQEAYFNNYTFITLSYLEFKDANGDFIDFECTYVNLNGRLRPLSWDIDFDGMRTLLQTDTNPYYGWSKRSDGPQPPNPLYDRSNLLEGTTLFVIKPARQPHSVIHKSFDNRGNQMTNLSLQNVIDQEIGTIIQGQSGVNRYIFDRNYNEAGNVIIKMLSNSRWLLNLRAIRLVDTTTGEELPYTMESVGFSVPVTLDLSILQRSPPTREGIHWNERNWPKTTIGYEVGSYFRLTPTNPLDIYRVKKVEVLMYKGDRSEIIEVTVNSMPNPIPQIHARKSGNNEYNAWDSRITQTLIFP